MSGGCYYDRRIKKENGLYRRSVALWMYRLFFLTGEGGFAYFKTGLFITENEYKME